jgi:lantibiotic modifying enzyme
MAAMLPSPMRVLGHDWPAMDGPWLGAARKAGLWIERSALTDAQGMRWPADPNDPKSVSLDMYNGTTGVVLYWLELYHATKDPWALKMATAGAGYLSATLPTAAGEVDCGLYTGLAGVAYTLAMTQKASGDSRYGDAARRAVALIVSSAKRTEGGVSWADSTDIISGSAGIGLFLLWASRELGDKNLVDLAAAAGRQVVAAGSPANGGTMWRVNATMPRNYPNFSHGTAGVSYFLATLHETTQDRLFLELAKAGERYLRSISTATERDGRMVFHSEPGNEKLFYLSWCHGPAGTARLYHKLGKITGDPAYHSYVDQLATATVDMKVPAQSPGYWNNISQCCGNCGVAEFFISLSAARKSAEHLAFATKVAEDTMRRGTEDGGTLRWIQAENRVSPTSLVAQTGLMQGAAGVGIALLHLDGATTGRPPYMVLPDNPWT